MNLEQDKVGWLFNGNGILAYPSPINKDSGIVAIKNHNPTKEVQVEKFTWFSTHTGSIMVFHDVNPEDQLKEFHYEWKCFPLKVWGAVYITVLIFWINHP